MLHKKKFHLQSYSCVLCNRNIMETRDHLFFHCPFAMTCWRDICPNFTPGQSVHEHIAAIKQELHVPFHMEIITAAAWSIWRIRNECIFNGITPSLYRCRNLFKEELNLVFRRAKRKNYHAFQSWIHNFS
ncbi:hypothetical protein BRADI_3g24550v3 [Brachypodium distachyon]|uniref:Reverse transcriptase zinc-binding domain-containing protein n=1 Tax=Brachypodium distachyon TaxID=15368 RepID=A0A2K2CZ57_BRADI|nr:hypothetical protein BRADI_3g24550v3 [Brachypodium distachyon]